MNGDHLGRELARQIHALASLREEKKEALTSFKLREQAISKEISAIGNDWLKRGQRNHE